MNEKLDVLPGFLVQGIVRADGNTFIDGSFSRQGAAAVGDRGWLFVSQAESTIGDVVALWDHAARLEVPNWSMTPHIHVGANLPWLDARWQARDIAFLLDETKEWLRVTYRPTDMVVFAEAVLRCARCGWAGDPASGLRRCPTCNEELTATEIFGNQEAAFQLDPGRRFVELRPRAWDHDHCLICDMAIGRSVPAGYRESSFAEGPNSVGLWLCEKCFERYMRLRDFSFLVRHLS